jgi:hypothetical protein
MKQQLDYNNGKAVFSTWSVPKGYKRDKESLVSFVRESVKKGHQPGSRELAFVGAVTGKRLVTLRALDCVF